MCLDHYCSLGTSHSLHMLCVGAKARGRKCPGRSLASSVGQPTQEAFFFSFDDSLLPLVFLARPLLRSAALEPTAASPLPPKQQINSRPLHCHLAPSSPAPASLRCFSLPSSAQPTSLLTNLPLPHNSCCPRTLLFPPGPICAYLLGARPFDCLA